ncbi:hypothetical protein MVG78_01515 [Roseomonas gilardii subsp. gilardii]|uniref:hypothetical protein n=1 Tax=Roseomonas gilardii TaxID=257708 RepID=UPI001FF7052D|nr:hypothetical protein [Roseomonas gilardii]UPG72904.1 hypothetical protein MVG78_01515 [Roseomonas gilardii subsp. gilardii]
MAEADRNLTAQDILATIRPADLMRAVALLDRAALRSTRQLLNLPPDVPSNVRGKIRGRANRARESATMLRRLAMAMEETAETA